MGRASESLLPIRRYTPGTIIPPHLQETPMHVSKAVPILLFAVFLALAAGCTTPSSPGGGVTTTPAGGGGGTGGQDPVVAGPVVTLPAGFGVEYQVTRDQITTTPDITVEFRGGQGQIHLRTMKVVLIREDGSTETKYLYSSTSDQIKVGEAVTFRGSLGTDRIIIVVTTGGKEYKIHDGLYEFKSHP
jgi:hypothetical protein